jgi:hypothetical protein
MERAQGAGAVRNFRRLAATFSPIVTRSHRTPSQRTPSQRTSSHHTSSHHTSSARHALRIAGGLGLATGLLAAGTLSAPGASASTSVAAASSSPYSTTLNTKHPLPAGKNPSEIAKEVCAREAKKDIRETLGVRAVVSKPTWVNHAYSCRYQYPNGQFQLTVKELSSWPQTYAYFGAIGRVQGNDQTIPNLGQGAFRTDNGWTIVRKDWKVLTVNISGLPAQFGKPPTSRADVSVTIADVILACWAGD